MIDAPICVYAVKTVSNFEAILEKEDGQHNALQNLKNLKELHLKIVDNSLDRLIKR